MPTPPSKPIRPIKAISLWQPWASLMAAGAKHIETRDWYPRSLKPGQLVAIHAAKHWEGDELEMIQDDPFFLRYLTLAQRRGLWSFRNPPLGCIVAIARYTQSIKTDRLRPTLTMREEAFGDYSTGRWGWVFGEIRAIRPIPCSGQPSLFDWAPAPGQLTYIGEPSPIEQQTVRTFTKPPRGEERSIIR